MATARRRLGTDGGPVDVQIPQIQIDFANVGRWERVLVGRTSAVANRLDAAMAGLVVVVQTGQDDGRGYAIATIERWRLHQTG